MPSPSPVFDAGMFFRFGSLARAGLRSPTCFKAILAGERTSTTRFPGDGAAQYERWRRLAVGDLVRVWSGPFLKGAYVGESAMIVITEPAREIDLAALSPTEREDWSLAEGWAAVRIDTWILEGHATSGIQIRYRLRNEIGRSSVQETTTGPSS